VDLETLAADIEAYYRDTAATFAAAQARSGLACPPGCGRCCLHPDIRVAPLEMLPMALELWRRGVAERVLTELESAGDICHAFQAGEREGQGSCGQYAHRPFICRAFGVAAVIGKNGPAASVCATLKGQVDAPIVEASELPVLSDWYAGLGTLHPELSDSQININDALRLCLNRILTIKHFQD